MKSSLVNKRLSDVLDKKVVGVASGKVEVKANRQDPDVDYGLDHDDDDDDEEQEVDTTRPFQPGVASTPITLVNQ